MKPNILAIDTSTEACSAAILQQSGCVWRFEITPNTHTALLLPMITSLLAETGLSLQDLDAIAVTRGPGSFTGVRIGVGMAQGISFGLKIPVYEISTLAALALQAEANGRVIVAIDARMQEVYTATFDCDAKCIRMIDEENLYKPAMLIEQALIQREYPTTLIGTGWDAYHGLIGVMPPNWQLLSNRLPHAKEVAQLAYQQYFLGLKGVMAAGVKPVYLRDNVAEKKSPARYPSSLTT